ncbi:MAG TPA: SDR family NAD(P)-dependent oxidoreductase [Acidimicrobiia bacterium]|nr:SDR family NAD(P)-dependent oxidoreductase [Acidimicrobiia bacterium]
MSEWSLKGREVVITGASDGIGRATARALAGSGAGLLLVGRNRPRYLPVLDEIRSGGGEAELIEADLADLSSVAAAGRQLASRSPAPAVLINNAATTGRGGTRDGFDLAFGVNHLAHFLLTRLLLPGLAEGGPARILNLSSNAHYGLRSFTWEEAAPRHLTFSGFTQYRRSKAANIAFTVELSRRLAGSEVIALAIHPGVVATGLYDRLPRPWRGWVKAGMASPEQGAVVTIECATVPWVEAGAYYTPEGIRSPAPYASSAESAHQLWNLSERLVQPWL